MLELNIGSNRFHVASIAGRMAVSELFRFEISAWSTEDPPAENDLLGQNATLTLGESEKRRLTLQGIVVSLRRTLRSNGGGNLDVVFEPAASALRIGRDHRVFQEMDVVEVVKKVLADAGIDAVRWETTQTYTKRPYWAQYGESDWVFITRILSEHGIYFWFDVSSESTTLVFSDDSTQAPTIEGDPALAFHDDDGLLPTGEVVLRVAAEHRVTSGKVTLREYDFDKPKFDLTKQEGDGPLEVYDFPGRYTDPDAGAWRARVLLESMQARGAHVSGLTNSPRIAVGRTFELTDHPCTKLNQKLFIESITYERKAADGDIVTRWSAIPLEKPFRPVRQAAAASSGGPQTGVVAGPQGEEIHVDDKGRIRVQHFWDREGKRDENASTLMRVGQYPLGGSMIVPRIGWEVMVHHHDGDVDQPMVLTHLYDGQFRPPYPLPANKTRTAWKTATTPGGGSTNEIRFEDKAGAEEMFINSSHDTNVVVGDTKSETIGVNSKEEIGADRKTDVGSNLKVGIKANQDVTIGASESLTVSGNRSVTVGGSESVSIGGSRSVTAIKGSNIDATGGRTVSVGGSMLATSALGVNRLVLGSLSVSVGGSWITVAGTGLANMTAGASAETVGGAKINAGASGSEISVQGAAAETVGGAYVITAGGNAGETATGPLVFSVGGAFIASAPSIEIEADTEISIRVLGSSLTIKKGSIEVKAPLILSPGATITKKASKIEHN